MSRKRLWYSADAQFTDDPKIADLGDAFGAEGPLAVVVLHGLAKLQDRDGRVASRLGTLARKAFLRTQVRAREILVMADQLDIVADLDFEEDGTFSLHFPHWDSWQTTRSNADRQRDYRDRKKAADEEEEGTESDDESAVIRRLFDLWLQSIHANTRPQPKLTPGRRRVTRARLREGYAEETLAAAIRGNAGSEWHQGRNERKRTYNDLTLIFRNGEKVEQFAAMPPPDETALAIRERGPDPDGDDLADAYA
jgi:hypothetical protein